MNRNLKTAIEDFETEISKLRRELKNYKAKPGHSPKFAEFKQVRINIMQNVIVALNDYSALNDSLVYQTEKQIATLEITVFKLEAICLLHGVGSSIFTYLQMPDTTLGNLVKQCYNQNWRQTPLEILADYTKKEVAHAEKPLFSPKKLQEISTRIIKGI